MIEKSIQSHDGISLRYALSDVKPGQPWLAFIIPFGLKVEMAQHFLDFYEPQYNVVTWETRSILDDSERAIGEAEFSVDNHIEDTRTVLAACAAKKFTIVGYCSGAGIALGLANRYPDLIDQLVLVHGEYTLLGKKECTTQFAMEIDSLLSLAGKDEETLSLVYEKVKKERFDDGMSNRPDGIDLPFTKLQYLRRHSANYMSYKSTDYLELAKSVPHQTLVMTGERDAQANVKSSQEIAERIPNAQIFIDPEADHYGPLREDSATMITIWNYLCELELECA